MKPRCWRVCIVLATAALTACGGGDSAASEWAKIADDDGFTRTISEQECVTSRTDITNALGYFSGGSSTINGRVCEIEVTHEEHGPIKLDLWPRLYEIAVSENEEIRSSGDWDNEGAETSGDDYAFWPNPTCSFRVNTGWGHVSGIGIAVDQSDCQTLASDLSEVAVNGFGVSPDATPGEDLSLIHI